MLLVKTAQERGSHDDRTTDTKTPSQRSHEHCVHYSPGCFLVGNPGPGYPGTSRHSGLCPPNGLAPTADQQVPLNHYQSDTPVEIISYDFMERSSVLLAPTTFTGGLIVIVDIFL